MAIDLHDLEGMVIPGSRSLFRGFPNLFGVELSQFLNRYLDSLETWWVGRPTNIHQCQGHMSRSR